MTIQQWNGYSVSANETVLTSFDPEGETEEWICNQKKRETGNKRQRRRRWVGKRGCKKTKITKACVCLSLVFSTPLHKIPPSLFSIPSSLSLSSSLLPVIGQLVGFHKATNLFSPHPSGSESSHWRGKSEAGEKESSGAAVSIHHFGGSFERAEEVGDERQSLSWTLTGLGLTGHHHTDTHSSIIFPRFFSNMSSSSSNLHNKRLPCE